MKLILAATFILLHNCSFAQPASDIYLFDLRIVNGQVILSKGANLTRRKGYDNQPFFHPAKPIIYYSSANDSGRTDIKTYNYETKEVTTFATTHEREYSPQVTLKEDYLSCVVQRDNGAQDLVQFPITGGKPITLVWHLVIGYYAWANEDQVFLFVLDDSIHNSLHNYHLKANSDTVVSENIGRSIQPIPHESAISYVQKLADKQSVIKRYSLATGVSSPIINCLPGQDLFCWVTNEATGERILLCSDGTHIYSYLEDSHIEFRDKKWQPVIVEGNSSMLKGVTRLASNSTKGKLAVVVGE